MQSKMTVFFREPRGIKDLVSGAQLFSNKALILKTNMFT